MASPSGDRNAWATRRQFLETGAKGIAAAAILSSCSGSPPPQQTVPAKSLSTVRVLGRTGFRLRAVSIGSTYDRGLVRAAIDAGIRYVHTSSSYAERNHERMLGETLSALPRDAFVIGTSPELPARFPGGGLPSLDVGQDVDPALVVNSMHESLKMLGLDRVDIYYLASVGTRRTALHAPYIEAYEKLKRDGLTRFIGITTHANEPEVIRAAVESKAWDVVATAYNFRQSHREEVARAIAEADAAGLGVIAMKTQAGVHWDRFRLRKINMKAALKWVLQNEHVHTTIPAFSNYDELREDLEVLEAPALTPAERADLGLGKAAGLPGVFCQQCGRCLEQCPAGMNVPALMRASMYVFGYQQPDRARQVLDTWTRNDVTCASCRRCDVRCVLGLDVRGTALAMVEQESAAFPA
jgi:predicted aldo/keto reductase-like oxidoreductase